MAVYGAFERAFAHAASPQPLAHDRVVHQLSKNCERAGGGELSGLRDRVAHAETHSKVVSEQDFHSLGADRFSEEGARLACAARIPSASPSEPSFVRQSLGAKKL